MWIYFIKDTTFIFFTLIGIVKFLINYCFGIMYPFTAEVYVTALRSAGTGFNNSICRIGGVIMPWVTFWFFAFGDKGPFLSFFIVSGLSAISAITIK
jgi:putative MFS transporter